MIHLHTPREDRAMHYLIIQTGKHRGRKIRLVPGQEFLIGRDPSCHLRLASTDVSRQHCAIRGDKSGWTVTDLGSRNGTLIDGFRIESTFPLKPGSVLQVGPMQFLLPGTKSPTPASATDEAASDYEIAAWLTEEGETKDANIGDSTVIPPFKSKPDPSPESLLDSHPHAAEAAAIIRQHWRTRPSTPSA